METSPDFALLANQVPLTLPWETYPVISDKMRCRFVKGYGTVRNISYFLVDLLSEASLCAKLRGNTEQSQVNHWSDRWCSTDL